MKNIYIRIYKIWKFEKFYFINGIYRNINHLHILRSEVPFQNMAVLSYTYFYNISLCIQDQPFPSYVIYLFYALQISVKLRSKLGQKINYFPAFWAPAPTELQFSIIFFLWYVANQETNKTVPTIFFFSNIFWIIYF